MTASVGCCDEPFEKLVRLVGFTLELGMKLASYEKWMSGNLHDLDQLAVGRRAAKR